MRILFVTSEHPENQYGGVGTFTREYVTELKKYADVKCVYFHLKKDPPPSPDGIVDYVIRPNFVFDAFSPDARILETSSSLRAKVDPIIRSFCPDVIHCNDRQTFMPFRFDKNVFYSSHLMYTDMLGSSVIDDIFFQEVKVERCALESSSVLAVYSDFAARKVEKMTGGMCTPVVLPLGVRFENFYGGKTSSLVNAKRKLKICYFGRFENIQKGVNDFIFAVNSLGTAFKERHNIEYNLYGKGCFTPGLDLTLFDNIRFLQGEELFKAYRDADIVVVPSRYEPFGFTALEAMAAGALVLLPKGQGMDMFAECGYNALEIPNSEKGIAEKIEDVVCNFDEYKIIRENAVRTALRWSWKRSVFAHMYMYRLLMKGKIPEVNSAYRMEERAMLEAYNKSSDVEKLHCAEIEKKVLEKAVFSLVWNLMGGKEAVSEEEAAELMPSFLERTGKRLLVLTGAYQPEQKYISNNVEVFSVLNEGEWGITVRPECLPFDDGEFDYVFVCGAWETVVEPCGALVEMQRVSKKEVRIFYNTGLPHSWQFYNVENEKEWTSLTGKNWSVSFFDKNFCLPENPLLPRKDYFYKTVSFVRKPRSGMENLAIG